MQEEVASVLHQLADLIRQRDSEGFNLLYRQFAPIVFGMSFKIVRDATISEDLVQETFVKVWKNIDQFDEEKASFSTWLLNIGRYTTIDYLRSKQHKQRQKNQTAEKTEYSYTANTAGLNTDTTGLKGLVAKLEPKYRKIIDLIYFMGYTQEETAKILDIPLGTVKTRTRYALQILRNWM